MSKRLVKKINDPADSVQLDMGLLNSNIEEIEEEKRMQDMLAEANVVTIKPRKTIIRSTIVAENIPASSGALSHHTIPYIPVDNTLKFEFNCSIRAKRAQLVIPVILEERVRLPESWGDCVQDVLGCRLAINCSNFERDAASLASLYELIIARIKCPLLKGGNFDLNLSDYSIKGRHIQWLKVCNSFIRLFALPYFFTAHRIILHSINRRVIYTRICS